ncbi:YdcF family protein [candidate division WOR-3 bacterium]|nr:YdcF family protein [candidate division WOR-3 bacterium]
MIRTHRTGIVKGFLLCLLSIIIILAALSCIYFFHIYSFLSYEKIFKTDTVVVEGWISNSEMRQSANNILSNNVKRVIVPGDKAELALIHYPVNNYADIGRLRLIDCGVNEEKIITCPFETKRNRTLNAAVYVKKIIQKKGIKSFIIFTEDVHARKTYVSYKKVFGNKYKIGVMPIPNDVFDNKNWYKSSEGMKTVITESIAYIYLVCFQRFKHWE